MSGTLSVAGAEYTKNLQGKKRKVTFECQSCTRKFATRSHLVRHSRVHTGERRYACDYPGCEMRCSRKDNLQQHYRTHLVVNPRRANAQAILNGPSHDFDPDRTDSVAHDFSADNTKQQQLTSPTDLKPIIIAGNAISQSADPSSVQVGETRPLAINSNTHPGLAAGQSGDTNVNGADGPERDWSISPPPPLSSAYDYWYAHGCLPQAARNPASVSGSGSSGATSPEISNALELAPGQVPRGAAPPYVDSPATYYHPHPPPPPLGSSLTSTVNGGYSSYDAHGQEGGSANIAGGRYPLATATFPTAAEYQHAAPSHHHPHHGRSHSHSYSVGHTPSIGAPGANNGGYTRLGYQSATTSPHISHAHLHHHSNPNVNARYSTTGAESYEASPTSATASYANNRSLAGVGYAASGPTGSPTADRYPTSTYHTPHHSHSHSGSFSMPRPPQTQQPRETTDNSRPVTRNGSMSSSGYSMPVYPSHPAQMAYGVPVDMNHAQQPYSESPIQRHPSMPVSVSNSPRMASQPQQSPSVVLPPIRYADNEMGVAAAQHQQQQYGGMMGHFGGSWDRVNVSDARALPPQGHAMTR